MQLPSRPPCIKNSDCVAIIIFQSSPIAKEAAAAASLQMEQVFSSLVTDGIIYAN
jgi:hypothetical protein